MLLAIHLWPDFAVVAGLIIGAHWFWLFFINKSNRSVPPTHKGYQTGGGHASTITTEDNNILAKPAFGADALNLAVPQPSSMLPGEPSPALSGEATRSVTPLSAGEAEPYSGAGKTHEEEDKDLSAAQYPSAKEIYEEGLRRKYSEMNMLSLLGSLSNDQLSPADIMELENLSALTRSTESTYPYAMDKAWKVLSEPPASATSPSDSALLFQ